MKRLIIATFALLVSTGAASHATASTAELQVLHNAADPGAAIVDVYVNGDLFLNDFAFRAATPFVEVPAAVNLNIGIAPGNSGSAADVIADFDVTLVNGRRYIAVANGVLDPDSFALNPDGRSIGFTLFAQDGMRTRGRFGLVKVRAFHGASDAPEVDIRIRSAWGPWPLFRGLGYGDFSGYRSLLAREYVLEVTPGGDPGTVVASFKADLSGLRNGAAFVFASGFLNPTANQDGAAFGLFALLPDGTVIALPPEGQLAELQVIHNAAAAGAEVVDIYVNDDLFLNDFAFRTATPFVEVPAGVNLNIGVAPSTSGSAADVIADFDVVLEADQRYVAIANGLLTTTGYAANPDGQDITFTLFAKDGINKSRSWGWPRVIAFHGATDAPTVDIRKRTRWGGWKIFPRLTYGEFSRYRPLYPGRHVLNVTPAGQAGTVVASYLADLRGLRGQALVVFASGFLSPGDNQDGPGFGLYVALDDGTVVALPSATKSDDDLFVKDDTPQATYDLAQNFPNPFNPTTTIKFDLPRAAQVNLNVYDLAGRMVQTLVREYREAGSHQVTFDGRQLSSGMYFYRIDSGDYSATKSMMLVK